jgi:arabinogalactan endo-1,4-beta-galactosidase
MARLTDFLKFCVATPKITGAFYWSPEWYGEGMWKAFALFDVNGNARPTWQAFQSTLSRPGSD